MSESLIYSLEIHSEMIPKDFPICVPITSPLYNGIWIIIWALRNKTFSLIDWILIIFTDVWFWHKCMFILKSRNLSLWQISKRMAFLCFVGKTLICFNGKIFWFFKTWLYTLGLILEFKGLEIIAGVVKFLFLNQSDQFRDCQFLCVHVSCNILVCGHRHLYNDN